MTPRRRLSAEQRRDQITAATVAVIAADGYAGTTADAIARRAGVSKGLLWHYFDDLGALMEHTARTTVLAIANDVGSDIDLTAPAPDVVRAAVRRAARLLRTHPDERKAVSEIVANLRAADGSPRLSINDYDQLYTSQEKAIFRRGQDDGDFRAGLDPRAMAVTYQGAVDAMLGYLDANPDVDPEPFADTVADTLLHGLRTSQ